jgi:hypothetical protein
MQNSRRFIACTQSTGRVGKSTLAEGLISWMRFAEIDFAAVDADTQHQTISRRYPDKVTVFDATRTFDDFSQMIQELPPVPVILVDFPAQATAFLLEAAAHFNLIEFFERINVRPTLLIFAADDPTAQESAAGTIEFFEDAADYLLIENPARFKSGEFAQIAISAWLHERSTPTIRIPAVTATTMNAWQNLERQLERFVPLDEAKESEGLHDLSRMELDYFRNRFLVQFEDWADWILPDSNLIKNRVTRVSKRKFSRVNPLTNPLLRPASHGKGGN